MLAAVLGRAAGTLRCGSLTHLEPPAGSLPSWLFLPS